MTVKLETSINRYIGDTADSKPTGVPVGSTYLDRQTSILYVTYDGTNWVAKSTIVKAGANSGVDIGDVDVTSLPAGNLGQQAMAASLSVVPASNVTDATYIGDIKFGEALPAGTALIGKVGIDQTTPGTTNKVVSDPPTATPTPYNVTCTVADTEYSQALPANCRGFEFQARTEAVLRFAFATGKVAGPTAPYLTLKAGDYYSSPPLAQGASPSTLYVASPTAGTVCEMLAWV